MKLPIKPRYLIGTIAMIIVGVLMYTGELPTSMGATMLIGILLSLGAYRTVPPEAKN